jgi:hypothetical protein
MLVPAMDDVYVSSYLLVKRAMDLLGIFDFPPKAIDSPRIARRNSPNMNSARVRIALCFASSSLASRVIATEGSSGTIVTCGSPPTSRTRGACAQTSIPKKGQDRIR